MKSDRVKQCWTEGKWGRCVCVGGWTTPEALDWGHVDHAGCHFGWWMWVDGQVGRAWPRAQALTVTRSDTPSPPALTATSGRRHISKYVCRYYFIDNQNLCSSAGQKRREVKCCEWNAGETILSAPTRRQAAVFFTQQGVPFRTKSFHSILNCSFHPLGSPMLIRSSRKLINLTMREHFWYFDAIWSPQFICCHSSPVSWRLVLVLIA